MRRAVLSVALSLLIIFPATAAKFRVDHDPSCDFSRLRRYQWVKHPVMEAHPALDQQAIAGDIVMSEANEILMKRNYVPDEFAPDFLISWFVIEGNRLAEIDRTGAQWRGGPATAEESYPPIGGELKAGTLVIDVVEAKSGRLVWRAYYTDKLKKWAKRHKIIYKGTEKALAEFPPH